MLIDGVLSGMSGEDCEVDVVATFAGVEVGELGDTPGIDVMEVGVELGVEVDTTIDVEIVGVVELDTLVDVSSGVEEESEDDEDDVVVDGTAR